MDTGTSLNKFISQSGFCSRREADELIAQGRVTINKELAAVGNRVDNGDEVEIDGEPLGKQAKAIYIAFHKPRGITCTTDKEDKTNIIDAINHPKRIFPIGRLDKDSEGLIFLTNDGGIVNKILRAGNSHEKEYIVTTTKPYEPDFLKKMASGVRLGSDGTTLPCKTTGISKSGFRIILVQGLNRQIRRMCDALGHKVATLKRMRIMNIPITGLPLGHWRYLNPAEVETMMAMVAESTSEKKTVTRREFIPKRKKAGTDTAKPERKDASSKAEKPFAKKKETTAPKKVETEFKKRKKTSFKDYRRK